MGTEFKNGKNNVPRESKLIRDKNKTYSTATANEKTQSFTNYRETNTSTEISIKN